MYLQIYAKIHLIVCNQYFFVSATTVIVYFRSIICKLSPINEKYSLLLGIS